MQSRTKVRRRVLACMRCRKRKLSCDGKVPACTRCLDAGVPCVGFDSSTQREAPRSIADFLEAHIAGIEVPQSPTASRLSTRLGAAFPSPAASHDSEGHAGSWGSEECTYADGLVNQVMEDITPSFLGICKARPILSCVVKGTQLPSKRGPVVSTDLDENHPRSIINPQPTTSGPGNIDIKTANGLFHNYLERIITQYPIYHRNDVTTAFNSIYHPVSSPNQDSPRNRYIVSIIMAISLSTAARTKQKKANALAYSLIRHALQWVPEVATNDIPGLQAILLLTQYIFLNPSMADLWLLTGLISQAVIDLGLHQELPHDVQVSAYHRDMRRRLFWCAWEMEVGVCCIFLRPINLPVRRINVSFPVEFDDTAITQSGIDTNGRVSKFTSRRICKFRLIEAEIISVLWHGDPIPKECVSLEQWMEQCVSAIVGWRNEIYAAAAANKDPMFDARWKEMTLYSDIAYPYILVTLYRPSKRIPTPTTDHFLAALVNAVQVADGYLQQANADVGRIKYVFHPCHHVFNCSLIFLQGLQRYKQEVSEQHSWQEVDGWTQVFTKCFSAIAERWTAAKRCLDEYERLLAPIKQEYADFLAQKASFVPRPPPTAPMGHELANHYNYPVQIDEAFNLLTVFNPATGADIMDNLGAMAYSVPHDWTAEFGLNISSAMEAMPEV